MDTANLGQAMARMMERIEEDYPEADLGNFILVAEIQRRGEDDEESESYTTIRSYSSTDLVHVQIGILRLATISLEQGGE